MVEKRRFAFSVLDLTLVLTALRLGNDLSDVRENEQFADIDGSELAVASLPRYHINDFYDQSMYSSKVASLQHDRLNEQYNSLMRDVLRRAPEIQHTEQNNIRHINPGREVIAMVVNAPVMTLNMNFGGNFSHRIDPLHDNFNLFEAFEPSRMSEEAISALRISTQSTMEEYHPSTSTNTLNRTLPMGSPTDIAYEQNAFLPILNVTNFRLPEEQSMHTVDSFLSEFSAENESVEQTVSNQEVNSMFETPRLNRGELFPSLGAFDPLEEEPQSACAQTPTLDTVGLDHDYCSNGAEAPRARVTTYSVRAREKVTTRVIAAPVRRVRIPSEDEGVSMSVESALTGTRTGERRITIGSDSGLEEENEKENLAMDNSIRTAIAENCRDNSFLRNVSLPHKVLCARH